MLKRVFKNLEDVEDSVPETVRSITKAKEVSLDPSIVSHAVGFIAELAVKTGVSRERKALLAVLKGLAADKKSVRAFPMFYGVLAHPSCLLLMCCPVSGVDC
jgi:hypothetical protein